MMKEDTRSNFSSKLESLFDEFWEVFFFLSPEDFPHPAMGCRRGEYVVGAGPTA